MKGHERNLNFSSKTSITEKTITPSNKVQFQYFVCLLGRASLQTGHIKHVFLNFDFLTVF